MTPWDASLGCYDSVWVKKPGGAPVEHTVIALFIIPQIPDEPQQNSKMIQVDSFFGVGSW